MILQFALSFVNKLNTEPELTQGGSLELRQQHMPHWINLHTPNTFSLQSQHAAYVLPVVVKKIWSRWEYKEVKKEFSLSISKELFLSNLYATHWLWMLLAQCLIFGNFALIEKLHCLVSYIKITPSGNKLLNILRGKLVKPNTVLPAKAWLGPSHVLQIKIRPPN